MPEAIDQPTTSSSSPLAGPTLAAMLLAARQPPSDAAPSANPRADTASGRDTGLLALLASLAAMEAEADRLFGDDEDASYDSHEHLLGSEIITKRWHPLKAHIAMIPARTLAGLVGKARVGFQELEREVDADGSPEQDRNMAWGALRDLLALFGEVHPREGRSTIVELSKMKASLEDVANLYDIAGDQPCGKAADTAHDAAECIGDLTLSIRAKTPAEAEVQARQVLVDLEFIAAAADQSANLRLPISGTLSIYAVLAELAGVAPEKWIAERLAQHFTDAGEV